MNEMYCNTNLIFIIKSFVKINWQIKNIINTFHYDHTTHKTNTLNKELPKFHPISNTF